MMDNKSQDDAQQPQMRPTKTRYKAKSGSIFVKLRLKQEYITTMIPSGTDHVLYSVFNVFNASLNTLLLDIYSHTKSASRQFTSDL